MTRVARSAEVTVRNLQAKFPSAWEQQG
jgi:hypothetical protein